jgi:hypothetical protein
MKSHMWHALAAVFFKAFSYLESRLADMQRQGNAETRRKAGLGSSGKITGRIGIKRRDGRKKEGKDRREIKSRKQAPNKEHNFSVLRDWCDASDATSSTALFYCWSNETVLSRI